MRENYLISEWALIRRNELVDIPNQFEIHSDFLQTLSHEKFESAYREIGNLFYFMFWLFACGDFKGNVFITDTAQVRKMNKAKKTNLLLEVLCDYGFVFDGIKKYSLSSGDYLEIDYPDNRNVIKVLSAVARKVNNTQLKDVKNIYSGTVAYSNAFIGWNYKVLAEDMHTCSVAEDYDYVADKMHDEADRELISVLDNILTEKGYTRQKGDSNEGPMIRYYGKHSVYDYALDSDKGKLCLELRIRNAEKCLEYVNECPERIVEIFRHSDNGCQNRINGTCRFGVKYEFEEEEKWHCGCCGAPFKYIL